MLFYSREGCHELTEAVALARMEEMTSRPHPRLRSLWQWIIAEGQRTTVF